MNSFRLKGLQIAKSVVLRKDKAAMTYVAIRTREGEGLEDSNALQLTVTAKPRITMGEKQRGNT